jgi:hypothetical protein
VLADPGKDGGNDEAEVHEGVAGGTEDEHELPGLVIE